MYREPVPERMPDRVEYEVGTDVAKNYGKQRLLQEYPVTIRFLSIGCVIEVGCRSVPFSSSDEAMKQLNEYVSDPHKAIEKWRKIFE
jgi:hypothetical protein